MGCRKIHGAFIPNLDLLTSFSFIYAAVFCHNAEGVQLSFRHHMDVMFAVKFGDNYLNVSKVTDMIFRGVSVASVVLAPITLSRTFRTKILSGSVSAKTLETVILSEVCIRILTSSLLRSSTTLLKNTCMCVGVRHGPRSGDKRSILVATNAEASGCWRKGL